MVRQSDCVDFPQVTESLDRPTYLGRGSPSSLLLGRQNISLQDKQDWLLSDYVLHLGGHCYASKYLALLTFAFLIVVEADKKIKFHRVLALEYMTRLKRFSNTEYVVKSYFMICMSIIGLLVGYSRNIYTHFYPDNNTVILNQKSCPGSSETITGSRDSEDYFNCCLAVLPPCSPAPLRQTFPIFLYQEN